MSAEIIPMPTADRSPGIQPFQPSSFSEVVSLANVLSQAQIIPAGLRGKPNDVAAIVLHGASLGIDAMSAIRSMHIIEGKPTLSADLMAGLAKRSTACEYFIVVESTDAVATYETKRRGDPKPVRMSFTIEQARTAQLTGKGTWKAYPAAMLRARAASALARAVYSDLFAGVYDPDELEPTTIDVTPPAPAFDVTAWLDRVARATTGAELKELRAAIRAVWDTLTTDEKALCTKELDDAIEAGKARAARGERPVDANGVPQRTAADLAEVPL